MRHLNCISSQLIAKTLFCSFFALLLSACESVPHTTTPQAEEIEQLTSWKIQGKAAFKTDHQSQSANILWNQAGKQFEIVLSGPLGFKTTRMSGNDTLVSIESADIGIINTTDPSQTFYEEFGWHFPLNALKHWVKGEPLPNQSTQNEKRDAQNKLSSFHQAGWHVDFTRYQAFENFDLPNKIMLTNGKVSIKLIIKQWTFPKG